MTDSLTEGFAPPEEERELAKMTFLEHLEELRKRLIVSIIALGVGFLACWNFADRIFGLLSRPLSRFLPPGEKLVYTRLTEPFVLYMKVAFFAG
ncbi:MAG TPA: twin-arginine translocase subunit TatC, partial [Thermoanaerobaculia bacterium]